MMIESFTAGLKNCIKKPVDNDKIKEFSQEREENPAPFPNRLIETFRKPINFIPSRDKHL